jgi:hypothetical protein
MTNIATEIEGTIPSVNNKKIKIITLRLGGGLFNETKFWSGIDGEGWGKCR